MAVEKGVGFPITAIDQFSGAFAALKARVAGAQGDFLSLRGVVASFTGALGLASFAGFIKSSLDAHDQINKLSQKVGVAVGELSQFKYAAELSDVSTEALGKGIKGLSQKMVEAIDSTSRAGKIMAAMGVDVKGGTLPAIEKMAATFARLPDGPTKAALAVEIFGKAGMDMIPLLNQGTEGIQKLREEAVRLGLTMDADTAKAAEQFNDNLKAVKASGEKLGITLLNEAAPSLVRISEEMKRAAMEGGVLSAVLVGLREAWSEMFLGDPIKNRMGAINEEIGKLQAMVEEGPGLLERLTGLDQTDKLKSRIAALRAELQALQSFQAGTAPGRGAGAAAAVTPSKETETQIRNLLGIKDGAEKAGKAMKDLGLANEHVTAYLKNLADQEKIEIALLEHRTRLLRDLQQEEVEAINARDAVLDALEDGNAQLKIEIDTLGMASSARELYVLKLQYERDIKAALTPQDEERIRLLYAEREALITTAQQRADSLGAWDELSNRVASVATGISNWTDELRNFGKELLAIVAKRWVLQLGASLTGSTALSSAAGQVGQGSLAGSVLNAGMSWAGSTIPGVAAGGEFLSAATGSFMGPALPGSAAGMGQSVYAFMSNPVTLAILAVVAVAVALRARQGGPKEGGSFIGNFDASGALTGTSSERLYTPSGGDSAAREWGTSAATAYFQTLERFGGSSSGITFGFGYDQDPRGTADSRVTALVRGAGGQTLLDSTQTAGRDDEDFQRAIGLQTRRAILAALQGSELPEAISAILGMVDAATATADQIDAILGLADAFSTLSANLTDISVSSIVEEASRTSTQVFESQGQALLDLASRSTLTTESLGQLSQATAAYRQSAAALILEFENAKTQMADMFGQTSRNIQLAGLDRQGQYNFYQNESARLFDQIANASSADEVTRLASLINQDINAALNLLTPEQQVSMQQDWLTRLDTVNETVQERLTTLQETAARDANTTLDRIDKMMTDLATAQKEAADTQKTAAAEQLEAARTPIDLNVRVDTTTGFAAVTG